MKIGIHEFERGLLTEWTYKYVQILEFNKIPWIQLSASDDDFWDKVSGCTHFIYNWGGGTSSKQIAKMILPIIEHEYKIPCFPNMTTSWHFDDKIKQYFLLKSINAPVIQSYVFFDRKKALVWWEDISQLPIVFKLKSGASSSDVVLIKSKDYGKNLIIKMFGSGIYPGRIPGNRIFTKDRSFPKRIEFYLRKLYRIYQKRDASQYWGLEKNYVLFQCFQPDNNYDTRVTIIGKRAFAFRRFNRKNDFRSSGSGLIDYNPKEIRLECLSIAFEVSEKFGFQSMAYDFLLDENKKPVICEISYGYKDKAVFDCPGYWDPELLWHDGHYWPEFIHLLYFIDGKLKNPFV